MNPDKQRLAIAEACGWKMHDHPDCLAKKNGWISRDWKTWVMKPNGEITMHTCIPNYLNDLNAIFDAEKTLFDKHDRSDWFRYLTHLQNASCSGGNVTHTDYVHATAAQRAEAFLRTIGKWEDGE